MFAISWFCGVICFAIRVLRCGCGGQVLGLRLLFLCGMILLTSILYVMPSSTTICRCVAYTLVNNKVLVAI